MADAKKSKIYNNPGNIEIGQGYAGETGTYANNRNVLLLYLILLKWE